MKRLGTKLNESFENDFNDSQCSIKKFKDYKNEKCQSTQYDFAKIIYDLILKNKINVQNAFEVPLIKVQELQDFAIGDWNTLSTALENDAKIYSFKVDSFSNHAYKILGGLNRVQNDNFEEEILEYDQKKSPKKINKDEKREDGIKKKQFSEKDHKKFLETNIENINLKCEDLELQNDPLIEKSSSKFDAEGVNNLFQNFLSTDKHLQLNFSPFQIDFDNFNFNTNNKNAKYFTADDIGVKIEIDFKKLICETLKDKENKSNTNQKILSDANILNNSHLSQLSLSQISIQDDKDISFMQDEENEIIFEFGEAENEDFEDHLENLSQKVKSSQNSFFYSQSQSFEKFQMHDESKINLSLLDFDEDIFIGNGNSILQSVCANELQENIFWLGPDSMKSNLNSLMIRKKNKKTKQSFNETEVTALGINFEEDAQPIYLKECPLKLDLNSFFEEKIIEQMDPIKNQFLLPLDLRLDMNYLLCLFERPFFEKMNKEFATVDLMNSFTNIPLSQESKEIREQDQAMNKTLTPICELKEIIWKYLEEINQKTKKKKSYFSEILKNTYETISKTAKICSIQTVFLAILHLANEKNLEIDFIGSQNDFFTKISN